MTTQELIIQECDALKNTLLEKNRKYGDSATTKGVVFDIDPILAIKARLNDKISRLRNDNKDEDEDILKDVLGYIILLRIAQKRVELKPNPAAINWSGPVLTASFTDEQIRNIIIERNDL